MNVNVIVGVLVLVASACSMAEATPPRPTGAVAQARMETARYGVKGMTCQPCASRLQAGIRKLDGVTRADVDFPTKILTVQDVGSYDN